MLTLFHTGESGSSRRVPVTRPQSKASKHGHSFQFRQADVAPLIGETAYTLFRSNALVASDSVR